MFRKPGFDPVDQSSSKQNIELPGRQIMNSRYLASLREVSKIDLMTFLKFIRKTGEFQYVAGKHLVIISGVFKGKRKNPEIYQILPVNSREVPGNHDPQTKIAGSQCGVLAA